MSDDAWNAGFVKCLGVRLAGDLIGDVDERGEPIVGETFLLLLNAHHEPIPFKLPITRAEQTWETVFDTAADTSEPACLEGGSEYRVQERTFVVLRTRLREEEGEHLSGVEVEARRKGGAGARAAA